VSRQFLQQHASLVKDWIRAHVELTDWINGHLAEAKGLLNQQIQKETGRALPTAVVDEAFTRIEITYDPLRDTLLASARSAFEAGFLGRQMPDLSGLYDLDLLNQVLREMGRKAIL
jgi:sulfonate transport system substrate-binding protein